MMYAAAAVEAALQYLGTSRAIKVRAVLAKICIFTGLHVIVQVDGIYMRSIRDWDTFTIRTSQIITGQTAASSKATADAVVDALSYGVRMTP